MKRLCITTISILGTCLLSTYANSASFDCDKAASWVEKTVCENPELSKLDDAMAEKYKSNLVTSSDYEDSKAFKDRFIANQRIWLNFQRNTCKDTKCLIREYKEYIEEDTYYDWEDELNSSEFPNKDMFGEFSKNFQISVFNVDGKHKNTLQNAMNTLSINKVDKKPNLSVIESDLIFDNLHTCSIEDSIARWSQNHWVVNDDQPDETVELRLYPAMYKGKNQLLLRDINYQFSSGRCGVRGYFDRIILEHEVS